MLAKIVSLVFIN